MPAAGGGRFRPTPWDQLLTVLLASAGVPAAQLRKLILNPSTGRPVTMKTQ